MAAKTPRLPYELSLRVSGVDDDVSDIEMRSADGQKFTVASEVPDFIAPLLVSSPKLLETCCVLVSLVRLKYGNLDPDVWKIQEDALKLIEEARPR
jgi:hypothetical protein